MRPRFAVQGAGRALGRERRPGSADASESLWRSPQGVRSRDARSYTVKLEDHDGIIGIITFAGFAGMDAVDRQSLIGDIVETNLSQEERRQVQVIVGVTPDEGTGYLAGEDRGPASDSGEGGIDRNTGVGLFGPAAAGLVSSAYPRCGVQSARMGRHRLPEGIAA